ncbi:MAG: hypothetical protein ABSG63_07220 [Spirochaetia bacterium]
MKPVELKPEELVVAVELPIHPVVPDEPTPPVEIVKPIIAPL